MEKHKSIAYFSMEIALDNGMPTFSGGLGVLAGDTIRAAADLKVPMLAVTLLYRKGYFTQQLGDRWQQTETAAEWNPEAFLAEMPMRTWVKIEGRKVHLRAWNYEVKGCSGHSVPVYFLDTDLPENTEGDRTLTDHLYGGDQYYRLCQEIVLGIGGVRILRTMGYDKHLRFHLNEGHAALLTLELLDESARRYGRELFNEDDIKLVREKCVFTTHTPVPAGHDKFPTDLAMRVVQRPELITMKNLFCCDEKMNMTNLALNLSHYVNGVAKKHGETSRQMFPQFVRYQIDAITNGVHAATWTSAPFAALFDEHIPGWREDNFSLRYAFGIPLTILQDAHREAKSRLFDYVREKTGASLEENHFTIGFARRATAYKRADLIFNDAERFRRIASDAGPMQIIFSGKAHPQDREGKELIQRLFRMKETLSSDIRIVYLENYDTEAAGYLTAGVDVWLNTPRPPMEASGTSGMKAALNGVPSLSILDGWWIEGCIEGVTGWAIGEQTEESVDNENDRDARDAASLYGKLEKVVLPLFYNEPVRFAEVRRNAVAINGSFFNTHRMVLEYVSKAYL
jgi:glycogen phosphorylase